MGKNEKNKRLDDKKSPVEFSLTRNEHKEKLKKTVKYIFGLYSIPSM
jgi:ribosomal protein L23